MQGLNAGEKELTELVLSLDEKTLNDTEGPCAYFENYWLSRLCNPQRKIL